MAGYSAPKPQTGEENKAEKQLSGGLTGDREGWPHWATQACSWESGEEHTQAIGAAYVWQAAKVSWFPRIPVD